MIENLTPQQCWALLQRDPTAVIVDVRTKMEHLFVGHPLGAVHIAWKEAPDWQLNNNFINEVSNTVPDYTTPILLLCRSGQRSLDAALALDAIGYKHLINIADGFEGPLDAHKRRGNQAGWRFSGLPWQQS
ncbi:rhodanese-like domain-containing protein [Crenothrix polyspora]|jgi:rhodanese-related sulfurtransferase|uniref:Rhodanese-related sulfurtransferase n=1 Tax=Crenothrix polyspora TaxID=360316 RepID=A0A1R4H7L2_9GAMM|nr:rhodanese-like domain-containing protein [Crenothrix polyspora]SJM92233.1 Rhodanese-related sulfurtransferase [Crenothrix polyspora]